MVEHLSPGSDDNEIAAAYRARSILITGGAGCIGSNLCRALLEADAGRVVVLDDLSASESWNLPPSNRIQFIEASVLDKNKLAEALSHKPSVIFHLAAFFANQNSLEHPEEDLRINGLGTLRVLEASRALPVERFVYASSGCSVYGEDSPLPLKEDFVSIQLATPYQITKLLGELYLNFYCSHHKTPAVSARLFNVYGPGELPGLYRNVIPNFFFCAMQGQPLPVTGTGTETRDFTYVGDIVRGLLRCGLLPEAAGEAINLASGIETTIQNIAEQINSLTGNSAGIIYKDRRPWDKHLRRVASIEKGRVILGYEPATPIAEGLKNTLDWFREHRTEIERDARFQPGTGSA